MHFVLFFAMFPTLQVGVVRFQVSPSPSHPSPSSSFLLSSLSRSERTEQKRTDQKEQIQKEQLRKDRSAKTDQARPAIPASWTPNIPRGPTSYSRQLDSQYPSRPVQLYPTVAKTPGWGSCEENNFVVSPSVFGISFHFPLAPPSQKH